MELFRRRNLFVKTKRLWGIFFLLAFLVSYLGAHADGSKDLYPSGIAGGRAFLYSNNSAGDNSWPFKTIGTHYAYVKAGETIHAASSAQSLGNGKIVLTAPNGEVYDSGTGAGKPGRIVGRVNELAGPSNTGVVSGDMYSTYNRVAAAAQEGIWKIEFYPPNGLSDTGVPNPGNIAANGNWTQGTSNVTNGDKSGLVIAAWDVSVRNTANTAWEVGRVYTNVMNMHINVNQVAGYHGINYVLTKDGYVYKVNNNGNNGVGFTFFVNNNGFVNATTKEPIYKSLNDSKVATVVPQVHSPLTEDIPGQITHKIFYTQPSASLPSTAVGAVPGGNTWLKNTPATPKVTGLALKGVDGTGAFSQKGGYIEFNSNSQGRYTIEISPRAGSGVSFTKRTITGPSIAGLNKILWDGKDGAGVALSSGTYPLTVTVELQGAEVHFPFIDMEINPNGMILELLNGPDVSDERYRVYWNDSDITRGGVNSNTNERGKASSPQNASVGGQLSGPTGTAGHMWGQQTGNTSPLAAGDISYGYGNEKAIDTWTFIKGEKETIQPTATIQVADLSISSITPDKSFVLPGDELTVYVRAKNNGPSAVTGAGFGFVVPPGFEPVGAPIFNGRGCGTQGTAISYDAASNKYNAQLNLPNGCEVLYTIKLRPTAAAVQGPTELKATILRPNDVTDPDATNPDPNKPPTDPDYECANNGLGTPCNNIRTTVVDFSKEPVCTEDVAGENFSVSNGIAKTFTQPATSYGFVFDIYTLDNSFNLEINGTKLATKEIEFQHGGSQSEWLRQNIRFADGSIWKPADGFNNGGVGTPDVPDIWRLEGTPGNPIVRVVISPTGRVSMYGSKTSGGPLFPLELFNGNELNTITWNTTGTNTVKATQAVVSTTNMTGYGSGKNIIACPTYTLTKDGTFNDENGDGMAQAGETISYTFTVKNLGVLDINTVVLSDPMLGGVITAAPTGDVNNNQILDKTETWTYTVKYTIKEADIVNKGVYNQATLKGKNTVGTDQPPVQSTDPTPLQPGDVGYDPAKPDHTFVPLKPAPKLTLEKKGAYFDTNNDGKVNVGDKIVYTFKVSNTGNVSISGVMVTDPLITVTGGPITLAAGASDATTFKGEYLLKQTDIDKGGVYNLATAKGKDPSGTDVTTTSKDPNPLDPSDPNHPGVDPTCTDCTITPLPATPSMTVTKTVTSTGPYNTVGQAVTYAIVVTNTGNVTLKDIVLSDDNAAIPAGQENIGVLAPGAKATVTVTHVLTQADLNAGTVANQAVVAGNTPGGNPLTPVPSDDPSTPAPGDPTTVPVAQNGAVALAKVATAGTFAKVGDVITYTFTVKNTGNVTLRNLVLQDSKIAGTINLSVTTLEPGITATATATYTITQADLDAGTVINQATVKGLDPTNKEVTDLSGTDLTNDTKTETNLVFDPSIAVVKEASKGNYNKVGDQITYLFTITNTGNVTLSALNLVDTKISGAITPVKTTLAPGQSTTATAMYTIKQADLDAGTVVNTATATGTDPKGSTTTDKSGSGIDNDVPTTSELTQQPKIAVIKKAAAGTYTKVGDVINYTFTVTNTGNVTLTSVKLSDPKIGTAITLDKTTLAPGESAVGTASYAITQADIDQGKVTNQATATGTDPNNKTTTDKSGTTNDTDDPTVTPIAQNGSMRVQKVSSGPFTAAGQEITYTFTVTNTGNTTLQGVKVDDPKITGPISLSKTTLAPGESATATAKYTVTQADMDAGKVDNQATGSSTTPEVGPIPSDDPSKPGTEDPTETPAVQTGKLTLVKQAAAGTYKAVGDEISYTFIIKNEGNVTLRNIVLNDSRIVGSINLTTATLSPGQSTTATAKYKITQADLDAGEVVNTATATGKDPKGNDVSDVSGSNTANDLPTTTVLTQEGQIAIVKEAATGVYSKVGDLITYTFTVTNTGNVTLHNAAVTDSKIVGPITLTKTTLAPGEFTTATATYAVTQGDLDAGQVRNSARATALDPKDKTVSDISGTGLNNDDPVVTPLTQTGKVSLIKTAAPGPYVQAGDVIEYTFTVKNEGNVTLKNLLLTDSKIIGAITLAKTTLLPGESTTAVASYSVTQADVDAGQVINTATVTAKDPAGDKVTDLSGSSSANDTPTVTPITQSGRIALVKKAAAGTFEKVGDKITYQFTVTNTGNVTLDNIKVNDPRIGGAVSLNKTTLAPGESAMGSMVYNITQADIDAGQVVNTATATAKDPSDKDVTDVSGSDNSNNTPTVTPMKDAGSIAIIKKAKIAKYEAVGQNIEYTFTVKNTGNVTLTNVTVTDSKLTGAITLAKTTLAPGEETTGTGIYTITQADLNAGTFTNQAQAAGTKPNGDKVYDLSGSLYDNDSPTVTPLAQLGEMKVEKIYTSGAFNKAGDIITYQFTVTNTGNITLNDIVVTDPKIAGPIVLDVTVLDPTEQAVGTATYTVTQADIDRGEVLNKAIGTSSNPPVGPVESDDPTTPEPNDPTVTPGVRKGSVALVKTASTGTFAEVGDVIDYTFTVTNTGNISLRNIVVEDPKLGVTIIMDRVELAPGESTYGVAKYKITQADLDAGKVINTATATAVGPDGKEVSDISGTDTNNDTPTESTLVAAPAIAIVKQAAAGVYSKVGEEITYTFTVTNTGNQTLHNVQVADPLISTAIVLGKTTLAPGESTSGTAVYAITQNDLNNKQVINQAVAIGTTPNNKQVNDKSGSTATNDDETITELTWTPIVAVPDAAGPINGKDGAKIPSVLDNDKLDNKPVDPKDVNLTPGTIVDKDGKPATGIVMNPDGTITVDPNTPAGEYTYTYTICEKANTSNCSTTTVAIEVVAPKIEAIPDVFGPLNGKDGGTTPSVLDNDKLNGKPVDPKDVNLKPGTVVDKDGKPAPGIVMNPDGTISVDPNTPAGEYTYTYTICEKLNPTNCSTSEAKVKVEAAVIEAVVDTPPAINGKDGGKTPSVLDNDKLNGKPVVPSEVTLTPGTPVDKDGKPVTGIVMDPTTGVITVDPNTPAGEYTYPYTICEKLNPGNCSSSEAKVVVTAPPIEAVVDTPPAVNGKDGGKTPSVLDNDKLNGKPVDPKDVNLTPGTVVDKDGKPANGIVMNPDGTITVAPNTPAGEFVYTYTICEKLNPGNCSTNEAHIVVVPAPIVATDDAMKATWSRDQQQTESVLDNDRYNNKKVDLNEVTLMPGTPSNPGLSMNADGTIMIAPSTRPGTYTYPYTICEVLNPTNCSTAVATIVIESSDVFIPNAFTPNGDGTNDTFEIVGIENFDSVGLVIVNRWGNEVYRNDSYNNSWNGSGLNEGTYYYIVTLRKGGSENVRKGWVLIKTR